MGASAVAQTTTTLLEYGTDDVAWTESNYTAFTFSSTYWQTNGYSAAYSLDATYGPKIVTQRAATAEALATISPTSNTIINVDAEIYMWSYTGKYFSDGNACYFRFGNVWIMKNDYDKKYAYSFSSSPLETGNYTTSSTGTFRVHELSANQPCISISMEINTATNTLTSLVVKQTVNSTETQIWSLSNIALSEANYTDVAFGLLNAGHVTNGGITQALKSIKVTETTQAVSYADYTVHFVDGDGATVKADVTRSGEVGATVNANSADKEDYYNGDYKYVYASDGDGVKVKSDGSAELTVTYTKYAKYNYTVNAIDASNTILAELATGYVYADANSATTNIPYYVLYNGTLYYQSSNSNTTSIASDNQVVNITYASNTNDVVFYTEGENISGGIKISHANSSNGAAARALSNAKFATLDAGIYKIVARFIVGNGTSGETYATNPITVGTTALEYDVPAKTITTFTSEEFIVSESTDLYVTFAGSSISGVDYIYIVKTGDATVSATIGEYGYATFSSTSAVDLSNLPDGLEAYYVVAEGVSETAITLTEANTAVPAATGLILKGNAGDYDIPAAISGTALEDNLLFALDGSYSTLGAGTGGTNYVLSVQDEKVVFAPIGSTPAPVTAGHAALFVPSTSGGARALNIVFGNETQGISAVETAKAQDGQAYNLAGQRVSKVQKGLYIVNGKKVIMK